MQRNCSPESGAASALADTTPLKPTDDGNANADADADADSHHYSHVENTDAEGNQSLDEVNENKPETRASLRPLDRRHSALREGRGGNESGGGEGEGSGGRDGSGARRKLGSRGGGNGSAAGRRESASKFDSDYEISGRNPFFGFHFILPFCFLEGIAPRDRQRFSVRWIDNYGFHSRPATIARTDNRID